MKSTSSIATHVTDVYVTLTPTSNSGTMTAFDPNGTQVGTVSGGSRSVLHVNAADIGKIQITGNSYCIDDLKVTDP